MLSDRKTRSWGENSGRSSSEKQTRVMSKSSQSKKTRQSFRWNFYRLRRPNNRVSDENFPAKASVDYDDDTSTFIRIANWLIQSLNSPLLVSIFCLCARVGAKQRAFNVRRKFHRLNRRVRRRIGEDKSGEKWDLMISSTFFCRCSWLRQNVWALSCVSGNFIYVRREGKWMKSNE